MSDTSQGPGWWQASDGKWYPPEQAPGATPQPAGARLDVGAALSYGWEKFVANISTMILIVIIFFGVQFIFSMAVQFVRHRDHYRNRCFRRVHGRSGSRSCCFGGYRWTTSRSKHDVLYGASGTICHRSNPRRSPVVCRHHRMLHRLHRGAIVSSFLGIFHPRCQAEQRTSRRHQELVQSRQQERRRRAGFRHRRRAHQLGDLWPRNRCYRNCDRLCLSPAQRRSHRRLSTKAKSLEAPVIDGGLFAF